MALGLTRLIANYRNLRKALAEFRFQITPCLKAFSYGAVGVRQHSGGSKRLDLHLWADLLLVTEKMWGLCKPPNKSLAAGPRRDLGELVRLVHPSPAHGLVDIDN